MIILLFSGTIILNADIKLTSLYFYITFLEVKGLLLFSVYDTSTSSMICVSFSI